MFDAARVGDNTWHGPTLSGTGCTSVKVGNKAAWRVGDNHNCTMCNPGGTMHGTGIVLAGSYTVVFDSQPAARVTDKVIEPVAAVPPPTNPIITGARNVRIGDLPFGLLSSAVMARFCADWARLLDDWDSLDEDERKARMKEVADNALEGADCQKLEGITDDADAAHNGSFSPWDYAINMPDGIFKGGRPANSVGRTLFHETRHAEQTFNSARYLGGQGHSGAEILNLMPDDIPESIAKAGANNPIGQNTPAGQQGMMNFKQRNGAGDLGKDWNDEVLDDLKKHPEEKRIYENYRSLPNEMDAFGADAKLAAACGAVNDPPHSEAPESLPPEAFGDIMPSESG